MRSVTVIDDLIYTGCNKEFGFWKRDDFGVLQYTSLSERLEIDFLEEEEFWSIIKLDDYILFQSLNRIYIHNQVDNTYTVINSETTIHKMFLLNGNIYFQKSKDGIYRIENGMPKLVSDASIVKDNLLVNMFVHQDKVLIQTEDNGFYILEGNDLQQWNISANEVILNEHVFRSARFKRW